MQTLFYAALAFVVFAAVATPARIHDSDQPVAVANAMVQVNQYRMFMYVADQYMKTYSGGPGTLTWATLASVASAPSGALNVNMPAGWKVVVASDKSWVACTQIDERAIGAIQQLAVQAGKSLSQTQVATNSYVVVGATTDVTKASQCI